MARTDANPPMPEFREDYVLQEVDAAWLGKAVKQNANAGVAAGINSLGKEAELEGKKARAFPLRFVDGAVFLGPLKVGQVPPLF